MQSHTHTHFHTHTHTHTISITINIRSTDTSNIRTNKVSSYCRDCRGNESSKKLWRTDWNHFPWCLQAMHFREMEQHSWRKKICVPTADGRQVSKAIKLGLQQSPAKRLWLEKKNLRAHSQWHASVRHHVLLRSSVERMCRAAISSSLRRWATSCGHSFSNPSSPCTICCEWLFTGFWGSCKYIRLGCKMPSTLFAHISWVK